MTLSEGWIVSIVLGCVLVILIVLVALWYYKVFQKGKSSTKMSGGTNLSTIDEAGEPTENAADKWERLLQNYKSPQKSSSSYSMPAVEHSNSNESEDNDINEVEDDNQAYARAWARE